MYFLGDHGYVSGNKECTTLVKSGLKAGAAIKKKPAGKVSATNTKHEEVDQALANLGATGSQI